MLADPGIDGDEFQGPNQETCSDGWSAGDMPFPFIYPAEIEWDEVGRFVITFPDFG